jgi:hypothetical protein
VDRGDGVDGAGGDGGLWRGIHTELHSGYHVSSDVEVDFGVNVNVNVNVDTEYGRLAGLDVGHAADRALPDVLCHHPFTDDGAASDLGDGKRAHR